MKIRNRLTILSSLTFGIVFIAASFIIYFTFYRSSEKMIYNDLKKNCLLAGIYYLEEDELSQTQHIRAKVQFEESMQSSIARIYGADNSIRYGFEEDDRNINKEKLDYVRKYKTIQFRSQNYFYTGIFYTDNQGDFVVFVKTPNTEFLALTNELLYIMIIVLLVGLLSIYILSRVMSAIAYRPITDIVNQVNDIEASSLDRKIVFLNSKDELQELVNTFNNLLQRLSDTFIIQKNFINYVSHEFKTPMAAISGNLEVFAQKKRTQEEYNDVTEKVLGNVYQMEDILNTIMLLSGLKSSAEERKEYRVDELIWDISDAIHETDSLNAKLQIHTEVTDEKLLFAKGNGTQIKIALYNIIENAVKYSNGTAVKIELNNDDNRLEVVIRDFGKGISETDLKYIHQTFYRGKNVANVKGSGIGLSLATIIFKQNDVAFNITSKEQEGTTVTLLFPRL
ncbi:MAG: HAMP domain-containing histidine kinase [Flavobacterium sp.]|nr:MAG: HAMP domain-containing histidine kinase [Flavobacterium sp.]